ncbi:MAG: 3-deoxy-D-manno-octulosonic acid transferase [Flavobacteriales bacterium]
MPLLIGLGTALYHTGIRLAAPFVPKAKAWVRGRQGTWKRLEEKASALQGCLWIHCASVGEFEQARPVLEALKAQHSGLPILVTFFSPSGYEARKDFALATHVEYLPADSRANARRLQRLVRPKVAVFIKYEFWYHHLMALKEAGVPTYLVSAIFRPSQPFFAWYGAAHRAMLACFRHLFVQNQASKQLLASIGVHAVTVSGDTRFDRVLAIVERNETLPRAEAFRRADDTLVLVAGSTWPADEGIIFRALKDLPRLRLVIVPHELTPAHLNGIADHAPGPLVRWGEVGNSARTLLVDRMGYLSRIYRYADIAYVGGGFGSGIHNTLEAAAWGKPVIFGPNHARFAEAIGLIEAGAGYSIRNADELRLTLQALADGNEAREAASNAARDYVNDRRGATDRVVSVIRGVLE